jgi:hypothetical protein
LQFTKRLTTFFILAADAKQILGPAHRNTSMQKSFSRSFVDLGEFSRFKQSHPLNVRTCNCVGTVAGATAAYLQVSCWSPFVSSPSSSPASATHAQAAVHQRMQKACMTADSPFCVANCNFKIILNFSFI